MEKSFVLKGDICHSENPKSLQTLENGFLVCVDGVSQGAFPSLPDRFAGLPMVDCTGKLITPGLSDIHMHAPQFSFRALGMDLELLDWLNSITFPEESKYSDLAYAKKAYSMLLDDLVQGPNTRLVVYGTLHVPATAMLMEMLENSGLVSMVGKVNMDRNGPETLCEVSADQSIADTKRWLADVSNRFANTKPILTPRFIPSCTDDLMRQLSTLQKETGLPIQSHLSENQGEVAWVKDLCPGSSCYGDAYRAFDMFGNGVPTVMAHCVWSGEDETELMRERGVFVAHCPLSNIDLSSGIAPARRFLDRGLKMGLGSDMAGGYHTSIFRAMGDAVKMSKMRWRLVDQADKPLTVEEAFWLGTVGGGEFFGKVGKFDEGYEFDALVIDDEPLRPPYGLSIQDRLHRVVYLSDDRHIVKKFARGARVK